jgi:hypothetical protein
MRREGRGGLCRAGAAYRERSVQCAYREGAEVQGWVDVQGGGGGRVGGGAKCEAEGMGVVHIPVMRGAEGGAERREGREDGRRDLVAGVLG